MTKSKQSVLDGKRSSVKIRHISAVEQVCNHIKQAILSKEWPIDHKIPSEGDLAELYGVNRLTVRMALQKLSTLGIIETRIGDGSYVQNFSLGKILDEVSDFFIDEKPYEEVYALRMLIEVECCRLAIENATPEDLAQLKAQLDRYLAARNKLWQDGTPELLHAMVDEDILFHYQICRISHNSVYADIFFATRKIIRKYVADILRKKYEMSLARQFFDDPDTHTNIFEAICAKDFEACKVAYYETLNIVS